MLTKSKYDDYVAILREELVTALGCTEPIAIAYASAVARRILGADAVADRAVLLGKHH